ncbi:Gfo/Idh/MocA family protein [Bacteroides acidifaciens]|uniref:Gfo/Idh/MocA family protein n=1 Tax=Bacteroides acidifaciens TaxID=85831 RepID=UPI0026EA3505|nr:Gfo/Idh/MocA family oxidoreductase [Bacteroides acidifaciens]
MKNLIDSGIQRWRSLRNRKMLQSTYSAQYAFVGVGSHALQNLYPVLQYLGIRLKYICCKSPDKLALIEQRFAATGTTSLDTILNDSEVKGVFVCTSPQSHYEISSRVIASGKYLFVEKPPCQTLEQLENLIAADKQQFAMVGMQKRYSPLTRTLRKQLAKTEPISYIIQYYTGAYPEGNPFTDLFIHPVDLALYLFGNAEIEGVQRIDKKGATTVQALLSHGNVKGIMELSTAYSWTNPKETLHVNTPKGEYSLEQMERLCHYPHPTKIAGIPLEKLGLFTATEQALAVRNNFNPRVINNQLYTQGFLPEIKAFADMVEHSGENLSPLSSMQKTYALLASLT